MYALLLTLLLTVSPTPSAEETFNHFVDFFETATDTIPEDIRVLGVKIDDDHLILNVSGEILNYGGNANEQMLLEQLLAAAASLENIQYLTLLVESELVPLPEGRIIDTIIVSP